MTTVTGYTAEKMDEINDSTIVDGSVVGNNLILERRDGGTIDAGNVRGPTGTTGATGAAGAAGPMRLPIAPHILSSGPVLYDETGFLDLALNNVPVVSGRLYGLRMHVPMAVSNFFSDPEGGRWDFSVYRNGSLLQKIRNMGDVRNGNYWDSLDGEILWTPSATTSTDDFLIHANFVNGGMVFEVPAQQRWFMIVEYGVPGA